VIKSGRGPVITHLSERRIGVRGRHHRDWLDQRAGISTVSNVSLNEPATAPAASKT
jgi:hypothetical protein